MEPLKYTSINKLKKEGKLSDSDMFGNKLKSEKAKQLYGDNIRVHHQHYIPKDRKKYFHEEEISGGSLRSAMKKLGSYVKHKYEQVKTAVKPVVRDVKDYVKTVVHGRNDYPPAVRELIKKYGNKLIKSITIDRTPVVKALQSVLNFVSGGKFNERLDQMPYDEIFHLRIDITFDDNSVLAVEKNEVINMYEKPVKKEGGEQRVIEHIPEGTTLNAMLDEAKKIQGSKYFDYSAYNNNCQDFIMALLKGSNIGTPEDYAFVKQDSKSLFKNDSFLRKFANTVTDIGGKANEIIFGSGIGGSVVQSVIFDKDSWTVKKAIKWLKKHNFEGLDVDEKSDTLRFRQVEPSNKNSYATKSIGKDIEFVIMYTNKEKPTNNKYNKMPRESKMYDSDTDSGSDSEEFSGSGIRQEKALLKRMAKLTGDVEEHHAVHGGKINIAKAFKKLGKTIKKGWEKEIEDPAEKLANKAGKYITAKKGGLATDLIDYAVPAATSAIVGGLSGMATGGVGGVLGSAAGSKLGKEVIAPALHKATGAGVKGRKGRKTAMQQLFEAHDAREAEELKKNALEISKYMADEVKAMKRAKKLSGGSIHIDIASHNAKGKATNKMSGDGLGPRPAKGSPEMKEYMAKLRARRGKN